jgi:hypothetical protein
MVSKKLWSLLLAVAMGVVAVVISIGLPEMSSALALEPAGTEPMYLDPLAQPPPPNADDFQFVAFFTDDLTVQITDPSGNVVGEGVHGGEVKCKRNGCSQQTYLSFGLPLAESTVYEYKFTTRLALDPEEERVVVEGKGTISSRGQKERFSFTATFQNNRDGTVSVGYVASRPDASFIIPRAPGTFSIISRR